MRGVGLHAHHDLGLHLGLAEVDVGGLVLLSRTVIVESGSRCCVLHDRVGLAELRRELVVDGQLGEQLADRVVDLLGVLEVGPRREAESY